ncbi:MAG: thiamine pyrophosphate-dependent enzyme, partial [Rhodospirillales bacterium]|nr:thiamine pyrophosphate-dependent enzyme [Rhodospirillales bacterium]
HCLNQVKKDDTILINELGVQPDIMDLSLPGTLMSNSPAAGLGFGLGASLGAKLAAPKRDVIAIMGDGSYMFANPTPAHFVARAEGLPVLTIVNNNAMWNAVRASTIGMYPDGRTAKSNRLAMADLSPSPEFHQIMEACGGQGEKVEDPADLEAALRRGLEAVRAGRSALVNVIARPGR